MDEYGSELLQNFNEGKFQQVTDQVELHLKKYKDSTFGYSLLGNCLLSLKEYEKSILAFKKEIEFTKEKNHLPYFNLGRNYEELKKYDLAIKNFKKGYSIKPESHRVCYHMAMVYFKKNDLPQTEKFLKKAYQLNSNHINTVVNLLSILYGSKKYDEGIEIAEKAIENINAYQLFYNYGLLLNEKKNYAKSNEYNEKAIDLMPKEGKDYHEALILKANNLLLLGKPKEAIDISSEVLKIDNYNYAAFKNLSQCFGILGKYRESTFFNRLADGHIIFELNSKDKMEISLYHYKKGAF